MKAAGTSQKAWRLEQVVSGGQTGVDRAALDVALEMGLTCGGWCPKGRRAEDGSIPAKYPLRESPTTNYAERTALNVKDSQGTLILTRGSLRGGTALTKTFAERYHRPCLVVDLRDATTQLIQGWLVENSVRVLNVAGPRESSQPGIACQAAAFLRSLFGSTSPKHKPKAAAKITRSRVLT